jgi:protein-L-isoaspartate(D-aspartate) O-methyltransferase
VSNHDFSAMRAAMIASQLRTNNVDDPRVTDAINAVPREGFVPAERASLAYTDVSVPLGHGRALNPPMATARMLNDAQVRPLDRVLLVGSATGYAAAVLARLVSHVTALEQDAELAAIAATNLSGLHNVVVVNSPFTKPCQEDGAFDVIIIDGAVEILDATLVAQLADGGRLVTGIVDRGVTRLARGTKAGNTVSLVPFADMETVILPGFEKPAGFSF